MVSIPTAPTITCGIGYTPVSVVTTYKGGLLPISGVDVEFRGLNIPFVGQEKESKTTDILGLAETCKIVLTYVEVWVKKSGIDFGTGSGNWKFVSSGRPSTPTLYKQESLTTAPGLPLPPVIIPCTGSIVADVPNFTTLLSGLIYPPTTLAIPVRLTGSRTSVPMRLLVDGKEIERRSTGYYGFDLINTLKTAAADISISHTISIESTATDCTISPATFTVPSLKPTGIAPPSALCSQIMITVDTLNHPAEITDFNSTFYVYIRGVKEACKTDPTNPAFIKKVPKGTIGTITLGNLSSNFYLTDDGIADIDLARLINLPSLAGVTGGVTPPPVVVQLPPITQPTAKPCPAGSKTTRFRDAGTSLAAVQAYLPPGYTAEPTAFGGAGTFKITRPDRSYFYAQSCGDIDSLSRYKG